jgi:hypothetical protein
METGSTGEHRSGVKATEDIGSPTKKPVVGKDHSAAGHVLGMKMGLLRRLGSWAVEHKREIFWGLLFAWVMARFVFPPVHPPYYIRVVERSTNDEITANRLQDLERNWPTDLMIGDVPVKISVEKLQGGADEQDEAKKVAERLASAEDTLMVIGDLTTGVTRGSLPVYMESKPPVPYISTTASADALCHNCDDKHSLPFLQLSPTNKSEAESMLLWAQQKQKSRCLVVTDGSPAATDYSTELGADLSEAAEADASQRVRIVATFPLGLEKLPSKEDFNKWNVDCVLYAGHADTAGTLWGLIGDKGKLATQSNLLVVFSDGVVTGQHDFGLSYFTYAADAVDAADAHNLRYLDDAVQVAGSLVKDLNRRGGDISFRFRSLLHFEKVTSARINLARIMEENSINRTWYTCHSRPDDRCVFWEDDYRRANGLFHVWQLNGKMMDVDGWHRPKPPRK